MDLLQIPDVAGKRVQEALGGDWPSNLVSLRLRLWLRCLARKVAAM